MLERKVRYVEVHCVINKSINKTVGAITKNNKQLGLFFFNNMILSDGTSYWLISGNYCLEPLHHDVDQTTKIIR